MSPMEAHSGLPAEMARAEMVLGKCMEAPGGCPRIPATRELT